MMFKQSLGDETMQAIEQLGVKVIIPKTDGEAMALLPEVEAFTGVAIPPEWLERAGKLKWIQAISGLDTFFYPELRASPVVVTQVRAIYSDLIADHVFAFMLSFSRGLHRFLRAQWERRWARDAAKPALLAGQRLGILGFGGIGLEVAHRAHAFGMQIRALDPAPKGRPEYVSRIHPPSELREFLTDLDYLVIAPQCGSKWQSWTGKDGNEAR
jgi:phosphoglycerate dehydrogenase-like enzyme